MALSHEVKHRIFQVGLVFLGIAAFGLVVWLAALLRLTGSISPDGAFWLAVIAAAVGVLLVCLGHEHPPASNARIRMQEQLGEE